MTHPSADPMVGRTVAHYEIQARLGGGGMGVVYKALDRKLGRTVALKFLPPQWSHDETAKQRFVREAQAASATHHPVICTIHDVGTADDGQLFIVMAYYEGQTLKQRLETGPLPLEEALDIATQMAEGLAKAHAQGVIHRDIKPGNILLTEDGVRIVDFGLATFADALQLTIEGSTLGTAAYMSPEQVRGDGTDARTDVWSLGVVLYQMLAGHAPFRGAYAEAIAYAIRHEPPPPLREARPEIPEEVEQLVFRAVHKDPAVRFASGRELARALRQVRGQSVPIDLRTQAIPVPPEATAARARPRRRGATVMAAVLLLTSAPGGWWLLNPPPRMPVIVAPVSNQTGYDLLGQYQLAMTYALVTRLSTSRDVRPIAFARMLEPLRRFTAEGGPIPTRDAIQALADSTPAALVIVPTLLHESGEWWARVEFEDAASRARVADSFETARYPGALPKVAAYALIGELAAGVEERLGSRRSRVAGWFESLTTPDAAASSRYLESLDAADALARGIQAYGLLEYASAQEAFAEAFGHDPHHPVAAAWVSRMAHLLGQRQAALETRRRAEDLVSAATLPHEAVFVRAVVAESGGDLDRADRHYRELATRFGDEPAWALEFAAFLERAGRLDEAVTSYTGILERDPRLMQPRVELCRLYNSTRMSQASLARKSGEEARALFAAAGDRIGEAQALLCVAEVLRAQGDEGRQQAIAAVETALEIFEARGATYNLARALQYAGLVHGRADLPRAIAYWEQSRSLAEPIGNTALLAAVLTNLGVAHNALGQRAQALDYYRLSSQVSERRGDQRAAAYNKANAAAVLIEFGPSPEEGLREVESALRVIVELKDLNFEVFCRQLIAAYYRSTGSFAAAERELHRARAIAQDLSSGEDVASLTVDLGHLSFERGEYDAAGNAFRDVIAAGVEPAALEARIGLARVEARLGAFAAAEARLDAAAAVVEGGNTDLEPLLYATLGEVAYEAGRRDEARARFARAAALWAEEMPDAASVEARGYLGLLDAAAGRSRDAQAMVRACVDQARVMSRVAIEARCRVFLARILLPADPGGALEILDPARADALGPELRAQLHYWRGRAHAALGDDAAGAREGAIARQVLDGLRTTLPAAHQAAFAARPDHQPVFR